MVRVRITKDYKEYRQGDTVEVTPNIAFGLIDGGYAALTKDMVPNTDYALKTAKSPVKRSHGRSA